MTSSLLFGSALLLALQAQPTPAEDTAADASEAAATERAEPKKNPNKIICKRTKVVGSNLKKRICSTRAEWDALAQRGEDTTREMQRRRGNEPVN